ncbi:MAG: hypothetical protein ACHRHE_17035, partial [Tepidisphaerales bacterium]
FRRTGHALDHVTGPPFGKPPWYRSFQMAWDAGFAAPGAIHLIRLLLGMDLVHTAARMFDRRRELPAVRDSGRAIGCYATAPLALLVVLPAVIGLFQLRLEIDRELRGAVALSLMLLALCTCVVIVYRIVRWRTRVYRQDGPVGVLLALFMLAIRWTGSGALWLAIVPTAVGFVWIALDSMASR